jgi:Kef-type K+ transport system membrane component KefB
VEGDHPALTLVLALAVRILAQAIARHIRVPGIVILLVAGVALGPDGLGWVQPLALGPSSSSRAVSTWISRACAGSRRRYAGSSPSVPW